MKLAYITHSVPRRLSQAKESVCFFKWSLSLAAVQNVAIFGRNVRERIITFDTKYERVIGSLITDEQ